MIMAVLNFIIGVNSAENHYRNDLNPVHEILTELHYYIGGWSFILTTLGTCLLFFLGLGIIVNTGVLG